MPARIEDLDDVKRWVADHDGRNDAYWDAQHALNDKIEKRFDKFAIRLTAVERKIVWIAGFAAALGAGGGSVAATLLSAG